MPLYFNGGTAPLVPEGKWGEGVIMPGEPYETDTELGPPWTLDPEASQALESLRDATQGDTPESSQEALSGPDNAPEPPSGDSGAEQPAAPEVPEPQVHVEPNGDVVNDVTGLVVGHVDSTSPPGAAAN